MHPILTSVWFKTTFESHSLIKFIMRFSATLFALVFLGVGCSSAVSVDDQSVGVEPAAETVVQDTTDVSNSSVMYRTSGKIDIVFRVPEDWFVRQADAGSASIITIREVKSSEPQMTITLDISGEISTSSTLPSTLTEQILNSMILAPEDEQLTEAVPISEWTLEDTQN